MAMDGAVCGDAAMAAIDALSDEDKQDRSKVFRAMFTAVVNHIAANAVVTVTSVSGVTSGGASSGPGSGTIA